MSIKSIKYQKVDRKRTRKVHKGDIYDKERTKQKFIDAVGKIIRSKGYTALGVNHIAEVAGVDKKLIYVYFGSVNTLIETYILKQDYWSSSAAAFLDQLEDHKSDFGERLALSIPKLQFEHFLKSKEMQKILLWEISDKNKLMRKIADEREKIGSEIFKISDPLFDETDIDIRATYAIVIAGIYYLILHSKSNGSKFCELDINKEVDRNRILSELTRIVRSCYEDARGLKVKKKRISKR